MAFLTFAAITLLSCDSSESHSEVNFANNEIDHSSDHFPVDSLGDTAKLRSLKVSALLGEAGRASKLVEIYENCVSRSYSETIEDRTAATSCERQMRFWVQIGAENGDLDMMGVRFNDYFGENTCAHTYRAKYWLDRIIQRDRDEPWLSMEAEIKKRIASCNS